MAEDIAVSPSESSTTENEDTSPHTPERSAEVIEVSADVDTELEDQQIKANELAKKKQVSLSRLRGDRASFLLIAMYA